MTPADKLLKLCKDNNLVLSLSPFTINRVEDGSVIISPQKLTVTEGEPTPEPVQPVAPITETMSATPTVEEVTTNKPMEGGEGGANESQAPTATTQLGVDRGVTQ